MPIMKRIASMLLVLVLVLSWLPSVPSAFAEELSESATATTSATESTTEAAETTTEATGVTDPAEDAAGEADPTTDTSATDPTEVTEAPVMLADVTAAPNSENRGYVSGGTYTHIRTGPESANMGQHTGTKIIMGFSVTDEFNIAYEWHYLKELGWENISYCLDLSLTCSNNTAVSNVRVLTGTQVASAYGKNVALAILLADCYGEYDSISADLQNRRAAAQAFIWATVHRNWLDYWYYSDDLVFRESLNSEALVYYNSLKEQVAAWDENTSTFNLDDCLFIVTDTGNGQQPLITLIYKDEPGTTVSLQKSIAASSECIAQLQGNSMYSLAGAQYTISVDGAVVETLTTDANGYAASAQTYDPGTVLTVQETVAPPGFKLDTSTQTHTVIDGTNIIYVSDVPVLDPPFAITKVDKDTTDPQGDGSFSGAVFQWEYFDNYDWSGSPVRAWYFATNDAGIARYSPDFLSPNYTSDELYVAPDGQYQIPLGTVKITEIQNSLGYTVLPDSLYVSIVEDVGDPDGATQVWTAESLQHLMDMATGNFGVYEPIDTAVFGSLTIQKLDSENGTTPAEGADFADCEFTIYNRSAGPVKVGDYDIAQPGEICYVLTVDASGQAVTENIFSVGTYEIKETKGNCYYQTNEEWSYTFTITGEETNPVISAECTNTMHSGTIHIQKTDIFAQALPGARFALEWSEDGITWQRVTKSEEAVLGGCTSPDLDEEGCLTTDEEGKAIFTGLHPVVYYRVVEVKSPKNYTLLKEPIQVGQLLPGNDYEISYQIVNDEMFMLPLTGGYGLQMMIPAFTLGFTVLLLGAFACITKKRRA